MIPSMLNMVGVGQNIDHLAPQSCWRKAANYITPTAIARLKEMPSLFSIEEINMRSAKIDCFL